MDECLFCKVYDENRKEIFYEDESYFARFDLFPINPGHAEIIPVRHVAFLSELTKSEWNNLRDSLSNVIQELEKTDLRGYYNRFLQNPVNETSKRLCEDILKHVCLGKKPDAYNFGINDGRAAGRTVDHLHIHIIPRYFGDVENPRGGVRHIIPGKGFY